MGDHRFGSGRKRADRAVESGEPHDLGRAIDGGLLTPGRIRAQVPCRRWPQRLPRVEVAGRPQRDPLAGKAGPVPSGQLAGDVGNGRQRCACRHVPGLQLAVQRRDVDAAGGGTSLATQRLVEIPVGDAALGNGVAVERARHGHAGSRHVGHDARHLAEAAVGHAEEGIDRHEVLQRPQRRDASARALRGFECTPCPDVGGRWDGIGLFPDLQCGGVHGWLLRRWSGREGARLPDARHPPGD